jgi:Domain of unknown function (DUF4136)
LTGDRKLQIRRYQRLEHASVRKGSKKEKEMKTVRMLSVLALLLLATSAFGQKVTTDSVPGVNWSSFHTYSWGEGTPAQDPIMAQRIVSGIDAQLAAKGLKKVDSDPDLIVTYHAATDQQKSLNWNNFGGWGRFGGGMGSAQVDTMVIGQLKVYIGDYKQKKFIWSGTAQDSVNGDPQKNAKKLDKALTKMFQKFPPTS